MVFLFFLGRVVEAKVEKGKWLLFYFMAGFISAFLDSIIRGFILSGQSELPVVGASGAISGLAAVSALLSPFKIRINHKNFYFPVFIVSWIMVYSDFTDLFSSDHIAHWSHLAGFFSVFIAAYFLNSSDRVKIRNGFFLNLVFFSLTVILLYFIYER